jgi:hypothetical protein
LLHFFHDVLIDKSDLSGHYSELNNAVRAAAVTLSFTSKECHDPTRRRTNVALA